MTDTPAESSVCVVIPTHNRPTLLRDAVASVLAQDAPDFRVVIVDEASDPPVSESLTIRDPRLVVIRNDTPRGPGAARNQGAAAVPSAFVAFLDDDDVWLPGKLTSCLEAFRLHPEAGTVTHLMAFHGGPLDHGDGECRLVDDGVRRMLTRQPPHVDAVVVRREVHDAVRFDEEFEAAADLDYMLRLALAAPIVAVDRVLAVHGPAGATVSAIALERRIAGRRRFRRKHSHLFSDDEILGFYDMRLGHVLRRAGRRREAVAAFARAIAAHPKSNHAWKGLIAALMPATWVDRVARR